MFDRPSVWCSIGASLGSLDLIWRQAYIEALVCRIDLVFAGWSFERCRRSGAFLVSTQYPCLSPSVYPS
ncbi:hypothetical protein V2W45_1428409 [Cenococcum geophilum]